MSETSSIVVVVLTDIQIVHIYTNEAFLLSEGLKALAELILEFPNLQNNSKFVFVPGPQDPSAAHIVPRYV